MKSFIILSCLLAVAFGHVAKHGGYKGGYSKYGAASVSEAAEEESSSNYQSYSSAEKSESSYAAAAVEEESSSAGAYGYEAESYGAKSAAAYGKKNSYESYNAGAKSAAYGASKQYASSEYAAGSKQQYAASEYAAGSKQQYAASEYAAGSKQQYAASEYAAGSKQQYAASEYAGASKEAYASEYKAAAAKGYSAEGYSAKSAKGYSAEAYGSKSAAAYGQESYSGSSYKKSVKKTTSTTSSKKSAVYVEHWPSLYTVPLFEQICNINSKQKSQAVAKAVGQNQEYDIASAFSELSKKNAFFVNYIKAATGVQFKTHEEKEYFVKLIKQEPSYFLKFVHVFAKNPQVFKSDVGQYYISTSSAEIVENYEANQEYYSFESSSTSSFVQSVCKSSYYKKSLSKFFGVQNDDSKSVFNAYAKFYKQYPIGAALLSKKILLRQEIGEFSKYKISSSNYKSHYAQYTKTVKTEKVYKHSPYFFKFQSYYKKESKSSSSSSVSKKSSKYFG